MTTQPGSDPTSALVADQRAHWEQTYQANPRLYGEAPSEAVRAAIERFAGSKVRTVLELGAGHGRDTLALLAAGYTVTAVDYAATALSTLTEEAARRGVADRLQTLVHDVREPLPFADGSFDACYSHMLFTMALTTTELTALAREVHRVLRTGGWCVYTARTTSDAHFGAGRDLGDNMFENGGFIVHFFDRRLVEQLAAGFELVEVDDFTEGELPRRLWRVTMRSLGSPALG